MKKMQNYIKKFDEYVAEMNNKPLYDKIHSILEAFDNPLTDIEFKRSSTGLYSDFTLNKSYRITSDVILHGFMTYKFKVLTNSGIFSTDMTSSDKYRLLPTVKYGAEFILNDVEPNGLIFAALDDSIGRKNMYANFCKEYTSKNTSYVYVSDQIKQFRVFVIHKPEVSNDIISDVMLWCLDNTINFV